MTATPEQLQATSRRVTAGIWVCATITMAASLINGTTVFDALTQGAVAVVVGLLTALAIDASLVVVLLGDARMQAEGLEPSRWGRIARVLTAGFSLLLNCGASIKDHHYFLAILHAACPILIIVLSEYGQEVITQFARKARAQEQERQAAERRAAELVRERAERDERDRRALAHQRDLTAECERTAAAAAEQAAALERLAAAKRAAADTVGSAVASLHVMGEDGKPKPRKTPAKVEPARTRPRSGRRQAAIAYLATQHAAGRDLDAISAAEVDRAIGANGYTKKIFAELKAEIRLAGEVAG